MRKWIVQFCRGQGQGVQGLAAIEFGIMMPVLAVLFIATLDLGVGIYRSMQVQNATQAGSQYAAVKGFSADAITNAVKNATTFIDIVVTPAPSTFCACLANAEVVPISCSSTCSGGEVPGNYVKVAAQATYTPIFAYPFLPKSYTFARTSVVRLQ